MRAQFACLALAVALAACARGDGGAPTVYRGTDPAARRPAASTAAPAPQTDVAALPPGSGANGVVDYGGYSAIVARPGDTVESMASRVGLSAAALSSYNGLPAGWTPRPGDELILPPRPQGWSGPIETAAIDAPEPAPPVDAAVAPEADGAAAPDAAPPSSARFDLAEIGAGLGAEPPAEAAADAGAPVAPTASAPAAPSATDDSPRFVPAPDPAPAPEAVAETPPAATAEPEPEPEARVAARSAPPAEPAPSPAAAPAFITPVEGRLSRRYGESPGGDGVDFSAPAGASVMAAADGQVALVSESLGGYGTIVLIRHRDQLLTLYGRVEDVRVAKGDRVSQGDVIGVVAPTEGRDPSLHFEVRRGVESVDPARFLPG